jgi:hypothetical protein
MDGGGAGAAYTARTAEEVFRDLRGRRAGMIRALTDGTPAPPYRIGPLFPSACLDSPDSALVSFAAVADVDKFFKLCDPGERLRSLRFPLSVGDYGM